MDTKLASIRKIGNITCRTANDIVLGLERLKNTSDELFSQSLCNAILNDDMEIICGHIDWLRKKIGEDCMDDEKRKLVSKFYSEYFMRHPKNGEISSAEFISDALEHFS